MYVLIYVVIIGAAGLHAAWNAILKGGGKETNPFSKAALFNLVPAILTTLFIPFVGLPNEAAYPYLAVSCIIQSFYVILLAHAYQHGDLAQVLPIARGGSILVVTSIVTARSLLLNQNLVGISFLGIASLALGVAITSFRGQRQLDSRAVWFSLLTALTLGIGTTLDGYGARASGNPFAYALVLYILMGFFTLLTAAIQRRSSLVSDMCGGWRAGMVSGAISFFVYGVAIWAMTIIPIPNVVALRETTILWGVAIAYFILNERLDRFRVIGAIIIVIDVALIWRATIQT